MQVQHVIIMISKYRNKGPAKQILDPPIMQPLGRNNSSIHSYPDRSTIVISPLPPGGMKIITCFEGHQRATRGSAGYWQTGLVAAGLVYCAIITQLGRCELPELVVFTYS